MAISLEFIDFIVPISIIHEKYPGGWKQCLIDYEYGIGGRIWYDKYLFRDGAMAPHGIEILVNEWTAKGFEPYEEIDGKRYWKDFCIASMLSGSNDNEFGPEDFINEDDYWDLLENWDEILGIEGKPNRPSLLCKWLSISSSYRCAYLKGTKFGEIAGPNKPRIC